MLEERKIISLGIPDDIFDEVEEVTRALFEYKNPWVLQRYSFLTLIKSFLYKVFILSSFLYFYVV